MLGYAEIQKEGPDYFVRRRDVKSFRDSLSHLMADIFLSRSLIEMVGCMDIVRFTHSGIDKLKEYIIEAPFLGAGYEGEVFKQNFNISSSESNNASLKYQAANTTTKAIKIFNRWHGAVDFFENIQIYHPDPDCQNAIARNFVEKRIKNFNWYYHHVSSINRRNKLFKQMPDHTLPVNTIYVSPNNQLIGFSMMNVPDGEWLSWWELKSDEQKIFKGLGRTVDKLGPGNFVRYSLNGETKVMLVDPMF